MRSWVIHVVGFLPANFQLAKLPSIANLGSGMGHRWTER